ncbi:beta-eliminating lyase-related protein, partial [Priestia sp. SIMBA_032]|uniref:beta-eliminating lyase-related protein n=1 Tax=Priestia sp. SIMBA_032 TaxID=3085775 RepID=UPI00397CD3A1
AESGGPAALAGVMMHPLDAPRGMMTVAQVEDAIRPRSAHAPRSRLMVAEQTVNLAGGAVWPAEALRAVAETARKAGLA